MADRYDNQPTTPAAGRPYQSSPGTPSGQASQPRTPGASQSADYGTTTRGSQPARSSEPVRETLDQVKQQGQQAASSFVDQAREQTAMRLTDQKERTSDGLTSVASAFRQTGQQLRDQEQLLPAEYVDRAAEQMERFAHYLSARDMDQMVGDIERFARRQPALFLAGAFGLGLVAARFLKSSSQPGVAPAQGGSSIQRSIDVQVPVRTAYNQWTQFEEFPRFMEGVKEVRQLDDRRLHWRAEIAGKDEEWDAIITHQAPDQRISWHNTSGARNAGTVTFSPLGADQTRITLQMEYEPEGPVENVGAALGFVARRVEGDLQRFKEFIEARGAETGAWRGEIHSGVTGTQGAL